MNRLLYLLFTTVLFFFSSCEKDDIFTAELEEMRDYVANHYPDWNLIDTIPWVEDETSGFFYILDSTGVGDAIKPQLNSKDKVFIQLQGTLMRTNEQFIDISSNTEFEMDNLINGVQKAVSLMPKGSRIYVVLPSRLCYGYEGLTTSNSNIVVDIPSNAPLVFDIKLVELIAEEN